MLQKATWGLGSEPISGRFVGRRGSGGVQGKLVWPWSLQHFAAFFQKALDKQTPCPERVSWARGQMPVGVSPGVGQLGFGALGLQDIETRRPSLTPGGRGEGGRCLPFCVSLCPG